MYDVAKNVILSGRFELSAMLRKLDTLWMQGGLTDDQRTDLMQLAREKADPAMSVDLLARMDDLETRLRKLEDGSAAPGPVEDWPAWQVHKVYKTGDRITFTDGRHYTCQLPEHTVSTTWSPADYPAYWAEEK